MVNSKKVLDAKVFYSLSWTWGIIMNIIGAIVVACILLYGLIAKKSYKLEKFGYCYYLKVGSSNWGGVNLGMFFLVAPKAGIATKSHEHGHAIQNCYWGILFPFVIAIPSFFRYWYREIKYHKKNITPPTAYDDIWFEDDATLTGRKYRKYFRDIEKKVN